MRKLPDAVRKELAGLIAKAEHEIDLSDLPATSAKEWQGAARGQFYRPTKQQLTVRIDSDARPRPTTAGVSRARATMAV